MRVLSELQGRGIGSALVRRGFGEAARPGHKILVAVGHPDHYTRLAFLPAGENACPSSASRGPSWRWSWPRGLAGVAGEVCCPPLFQEVI